MSKIIVDEIQTDTTDGNVRIIPNGTGNLEVKGAGGDDATLQLNCSAQSHGVKLKSPAHSAGQSYTMILPDNNIEADKYLKVKSIESGSGTSAVGQLEFADVSAGGGGLTSDAQYNTVGGTNAGDSFTGTSAVGNTLIGYDAGTAVTTGDYNTIIGKDAGKTTTSGAENTYIGIESGLNATTGSLNTAVGQGTLKACTTGDSNTAIGTGAMKGGTVTGDKNTCVGNNCGYAINSGYNNTFVGTLAGTQHQSGYDNVAIGSNAFKSSVDDTGNTAVGSGSLENCTTNYNAAVGFNSANVQTTGYNTTAFGVYAGSEITSGDNNICIGYQAGNSNAPSGSITTGDNNICLGNNNITNLYCADTSISSSDSRDKTDVTSFTIGLNWIEALRPVTYRWDRRTWYGTDDEPYGTPDGSKKRQRLHVGFLAQEALEVEKANGYGNSNDDSLILNLTDDGMSYGMKYERLVPILVNAIKELSTRVKTLEGG